MEPLSLTANVITVLQVANSIVSACYEARAALRQSPWSLTRVVDEIKDLRNALESLEDIAGSLDPAKASDNARLRSLQLLCEPELGPLARCYQELAGLQKKITSTCGHGSPCSKPKALIQVMSWRLKESDAKACLERIERCKNTILLAMAADEAALLVDIKNLTASLNDTTKNIDQNVNDLLQRLETSELDEKAKAITHWLAPTDPWENHETAIAAHHSGTGEWFIKSDEFIRWCHSTGSGVWLSGFPGAGKTILFSNVVMSLTGKYSQLSEETLVAFFYCDFRKRESQDAVIVVGSLVAQICSRLGFCPTELGRAFDHSKKPPSFALLRDVLCSLSSLRRIVLLVDAVDECSEQNELLGFMVSLREASRNISIFLTSRYELDTRTALTSFEHLRLEEWTRLMNEDINAYIEHRLQSDQRLQWLKGSVKEEIRHCLSARSAGMFRLTQCTLDAVSSLRTVRSLRQALTQLPRGLGQTYENILVKVAETDVSTVRKILMWLSFTVLPITLDELHSAIAIEQGLDEFDEDSCLSSSQEILSVCGSLINVSESGHVRLAHMSVKDYLLSDEIRRSPAHSFALERISENRELALDCFTYLSFQEFQTGPSQSMESYAERLAGYPFLRHASTAWTYYLRATDPSAQLDPMVLAFFSHGNRQAFLSWVQVLNADTEAKWNLFPRHATSLYYAASFGLVDVVKYLIDSGANLNAPGSRYGGTALHGAVCRDHIQVVEVLLKAGALPSQADFDSVTPIHTAVSEGYINSVKLLLEYGASPDATDRGGETPLDWATKAGQKTCVELLTGSFECKENAAKVYEKVVWSGWGGYFPDWNPAVVVDVGQDGSRIEAQ